VESRITSLALLFVQNRKVVENLFAKYLVTKLTGGQREASKLERETIAELDVSQSATGRIRRGKLG
jgi:hypothetical protein